MTRMGYKKVNTLWKLAFALPFITLITASILSIIKPVRESKNLKVKNLALISYGLFSTFFDHRE